jgi:hypothetical protein
METRKCIVEVGYGTLYKAGRVFEVPKLAKAQFHRYADKWEYVDNEPFAQTYVIVELLEDAGRYGGVGSVLELKPKAVRFLDTVATEEPIAGEWLNAQE